MNGQTLRTGVRIKMPAGFAPERRTAGSSAAGPSAAEPRPAFVEDDRDRDTRPGRYAVRGAFLDLSRLEDPSFDPTDETCWERADGTSVA
jgi:hypothetical protein